MRTAKVQVVGHGISIFKLIIAPLIAYLTRLRFPVLFGITAVLFIVDSLIPDFIPFADEILLGLGAALLGSWKKRKDPGSPAPARQTKR